MVLQRHDPCGKHYFVLKLRTHRLCPWYFTAEGRRFVSRDLLSPFAKAMAY
jgi:hypothetical protein